MGWKEPTKIQAGAILHALEGRDLIGLGQTGSGKTGAFALPIIHALLEHNQAFFACVLSLTTSPFFSPSRVFVVVASVCGCLPCGFGGSGSWRFRFRSTVIVRGTVL